MTIAVVRTIIADPVQYDRSTAIGDGAAVDFELPNSPVYPASAKVYKDGALQTLVTHYTIDESTAVVTFVTAPGVNSAVVVTYKHSLLADADLQTFLDLEDLDDRLASALALDTIATSEALIQKRIRTLDISTDGPAVAAALRKHATTLRELAASTDSTDAGFDIAEQTLSAFATREIIINNALREQG